MKKILNIILTPFKMIWSIFDNDAHRIVSKKGLNLLQMEDKLNKQLAKETTESLTEWMESKQTGEKGKPLTYWGELKDDVEKLAETEYPIFDGDLVGIVHNQKHSRIDFIKGYNKAKENLYTEQQMIGFAEWIINQDMKLVLIYTKKSLLNEYIQSLKQK
jgi:hypothetical protein